MKPILKGNSQKMILWLGLLVALYALLLFGLFLFQEKMIFFPQVISETYCQELTNQYSDVEEIKFKTSDGVSLHGWLVKNPKSVKSPLIIYYGGNAEELSYLIAKFINIKGYSILLMNYRGYGLSTGLPNEKNLCQDAELIYDEMVKRNDIDTEKIVVMGRSIGTGLAVYMAEKRKVKGVILVTPYDTLISVAQEKIKWIPVFLIMRNRFDSLGRAPRIKVPVLALIAKEDEVIPAWHGIKLVKRWGGKTVLKIFDGVGHNTIENDSVYWKSIADFLITL